MEHTKHSRSRSPEDDRQHSSKKLKEDRRKRDGWRDNRRSDRRRNDFRRREDPDRRSNRSRSKTPDRKYPNAKEETNKENVDQPGNENKVGNTDGKKIAKKDDINLRTGGAYIPPAKLRMMAQNITDKSSAAYQRIAWEALKKSIHGLINKINVANIGIIVRSLFKENIVRGKGLLCRSLLQAQAASIKFTNVYAALIAVVNSKFPIIGELLIQRCVNQFKNSYRRNDKASCLAAATFIAHLVNQRMLHEIAALQILQFLLFRPTNDSVEIAIAFLKECGEKLGEVSPKGLFSVFDSLRKLLQEGDLDKRVQYMIEVMYQVRKDKFKDYPALIEELDLIDEEEQTMHLVSIDDKFDNQDILNVFRHDPDYEENENKYKELCKEILGDDDSGNDGEEGDSEGSDDSAEGDENDPDSEKNQIRDETETNLVAFRRTVYLTINSSLDFEECAHKLLKMQIKPGQEVELCHMFLDCCTQQRTYENFFGLLAQRFCQINRIYVEPLKQIFVDSYHTIHRLDTNRLRNVAKLFSHLLYSDAIPWTILAVIRLSEEDTTPSGRVFIKILFQELCEYMGLQKLRAKLSDPEMQEAVEGLFPKDNPKNTRFSINFFTLIGLGGLTDDLREWLKNGAIESNPPVIDAIQEAVEKAKKSKKAPSPKEKTKKSKKSKKQSLSKDFFVANQKIN